MILVYNEQGFNDTLLCLLHKQNEHAAHEVIAKGDIIQIKQDDTLVGINIKNARAKFANLPAGVGFDDSANQAVMDYIVAQTGLTNISTTLAQQFTIGYVKEKTAHPDSDKLSVCQVDVGTQVLQIVCGAANVAADQKVVVAQVGSMMPNGLIIEPAILRKVDSLGMICSAKELNLPAAFVAPGILVLPEDAPVGVSFVNYFEKEMMKK